MVEGIRYIGYCDYYKGKISSALFAEFNVDTLNDSEKETLYEYEFNDPEDNREGVNMLDNIYPFIYFGYDNQDSLVETGFIYNQKQDEQWSVFVENIYKTKKEALNVFISESESRMTKIEHAIIDLIFRGNFE